MLKKVSFFFLFLLIIISVVYSQSNSFSQRQSFNDVKNYSFSDIDLLLDSVSMQLETNPEKAFNFIEMAMILSLEEKDKTKQARTFEVLGVYYKHFKQYDLAAMNYQKSAQLYGAKNSRFFDNNLVAANLYLQAKEYQKSIDLFNLLLNSSVNKQQKLLIQEGLGDNNYSAKLFTEALVNFKEAEKIATELSQIDKNTEIKLKIAIILIEINDEKALQYLTEASKQAISTANGKLQLKSQNLLAEYYALNKMYKQEIESRNSISNTLTENIDVLQKQEINVSEESFRNNTSIAQALNGQNQPDEALDVIKKNEKLEQEKIGIEYKIEAAKTQSESYVELGLGNQAIESYKTYVDLVDELYRIKENEINEVIDVAKKLTDNQNRIVLLEQDKQLFDIQLQSMEKDQLLITESNKYQRNLIILLFIVVALLVFALISAFQRIRIQKKHNLFLDLKSLRTQMNPHFIFNALNSVNSFIAKNDEIKANKYLSSFSRLIRSILENSEYDFIPLSKEIEMLKSYIELENIRFADKFSYTFNIDKNINADEYRIPPMLIQPYIENAVWHGLRYKEKDGLLKVEIIKEDSCLKVEIIDNGIGRTKSQELKTENQKKNKSKGIVNTTKRLEILNKLYKQNIELNIEDLNHNQEGTKVTLTIPEL
ncbi:MAG: histidine kinase [Bacteroidetes bacterium]|nr:histidine kinase [Bacteroidota bacterium]